MPSAPLSPQQHACHFTRHAATGARLKWSLKQNYTAGLGDAAEFWKSRGSATLLIRGVLARALTKGS